MGGGVGAGRVGAAGQERLPFRFTLMELGCLCTYALLRIHLRALYTYASYEIQISFYYY